MRKRKGETLIERILRHVFDPQRRDNDHDTKSLGAAHHEGDTEENGRALTRLRIGEIHRAGIFQTRTGPVREGEGLQQTVYRLTDEAKLYGYKWALARVEARCAQEAAERKEEFLRIGSLKDPWKRVAALVSFRERGVTALSLASNKLARVNIEDVRFVIKALRRTVLGKTVRGKFFKDKKRWSLDSANKVVEELRARPSRTKFTIEAAPRQGKFRWGSSDEMKSHL